MKVGKNSPLPQSGDQEGTHFCKKCSQTGCLGFYRRTRKNDLPVCDECGHVYRSHELLEKENELENAEVGMIKHRRKWMQDSNGLHPGELIAKLDGDVHAVLTGRSGTKWRRFGKALHLK